MTSSLCNVRAALHKAAKQFRMYAESHAAKYTPEGNAKSQTNTVMAIEMERALNCLDELNKPRKLRELIAEGHEQFWVWDKFSPACWRLVVYSEYTGTKLIMVSGDGIHYCGSKSYLDYPAIPIIKPSAPDGEGAGS